MGMTLAEKIMAAHGGGGRAEPGLEVELSADRILLGERTVHRLLEEVRRSGREGAGGEGASRVVALLDQFLGPLDGDRKTSFRELRTFARRLGFLHLYGMGRGGIEAVLYADGGMGVPGALLVADDPVSGLLGALGALVVVPTKAGLMGAVRTGGVSVQVPETFRVILRGKPGPWVGGKDLAIELYSLLGPRGASGRCLEITGEAVDHLPVHQRLALAAFAVNTGARHVLFEPDEKTITFARARSDTPFRPVHGDPDAFVADVVELDVGSMEPRVALGPRPEEVRPVPKARDLRLDQVVIGGNGNGRIEDLRAAAALLREYRVNPNVRLVLVPGSQQVLLHAMEEGLVQDPAGFGLGAPRRFETGLQGLSRGAPFLPAELGRPFQVSLPEHGGEGPGEADQAEAFPQDSNAPQEGDEEPHDSGEKDEIHDGPALGKEAGDAFFGGETRQGQAARDVQGDYGKLILLGWGEFREGP